MAPVLLSRLLALDELSRSPAGSPWTFSPLSNRTTLRPFEELTVLDLELEELA